VIDTGFPISPIVDTLIIACFAEPILIIPIVLAAGLFRAAGRAAALAVAPVAPAVLAAGFFRAAGRAGALAVAPVAPVVGAAGLYHFADRAVALTVAPFAPAVLTLLAAVGALAGFIAVVVIVACIAADRASAHTAGRVAPVVAADLHTTAGLAYAPGAHPIAPLVAACLAALCAHSVIKGATAIFVRMVTRFAADAARAGLAAHG